MLLSMLLGVAFAGAPGNRLPEDALDALHGADSAVLYSLEPYEPLPMPSPPGSPAPVLHGYAVLGEVRLDGERLQAAATEFEAAIDRDEGILAMCFDPRHALRVTRDGHTYDLLLCYACGRAQVYRDGERIATLGAAGSDKPLNRLLADAGVAVSTTYDEDALRARQAASRVARVRWDTAMPRSLATVRMTDDDGIVDDTMIPGMRAALDADYPDATARILALYRWYGSGAGPWSGFPAYEEPAERLLLSHTTGDLLAALEAGALDEAQLEGAARLFGGWAFSRDRPRDGARIPEAWKTRLLAQALRSDDEDKRGRAQRAFGAR